MRTVKNIRDMKKNKLYIEIQFEICYYNEALIVVHVAQLDRACAF